MRLNVAATNIKHISNQKIDTLKAAIVAFVIGVTLIYAVGFRDAESIHDAAHDSRHTLSFPCH